MVEKSLDPADFVESHVSYLDDASNNERGSEPVQHQGGVSSVLENHLWLNV